MDQSTFQITDSASHVERVGQRPGCKEERDSDVEHVAAILKNSYRYEVLLMIGSFRRFFRRSDVDVGAGEKVVSSLAASFFAEGITHPEDVGAFAPRGVLPEGYRTLLVQPEGRRSHSSCTRCVRIKRCSWTKCTTSSGALSKSSVVSSVRCCLAMSST